MVFSLDVLTTREDGWDRDAIVRGFSGRGLDGSAARRTDMQRPYLNAVGKVLPKAEIVFDEFHVLQHASAALDEVRRQEFLGLCSSPSLVRSQKLLMAKIVCRA
jgi:transposase